MLTRDIGSMLQPLEAEVQAAILYLSGLRNDRNQYVISKLKRYVHRGITI